MPPKSNAEAFNSLIEIAQVLKPVGLRGELKVYPYTRSPEDLGRYRFFILEASAGQQSEIELEEIRSKGNVAILKFKGVDHIDQAEQLSGYRLLIDRSQFPDTDQDEFYIRDLIGLEVRKSDGSYIGHLEDIIELAAHDIYQVKGTDKTFLIPAHKDFIEQVDVENRRIIVKWIEGLEDI